MKNASLRDDTMRSVSMADLVESVFTAPPDMMVRDVKKRIEVQDDPISSLVVVDGERPVGLVMSLHLDRVLSQQYGVALYHKRPVSDVMDAAPLVADAGSALDVVASQAMQREKDKIFDHVIVTKDGQLAGIVTVQAMLSTLASLHQQRTRDMERINTKLKQANTKTEAMHHELADAYVKLREVDELKTDFLSMVSHELRTPLTSVLGFAEITQNDLETVIFPCVPTPDKRAGRTMKNVSKNLSIILEEGERLTALINDVLDIAKMEAGKVDWKSESMDINEIVRRALASTASLFTKKNIESVVAIDPDLPGLKGDKDRVIQVVVNLISNAVKFTDSGSVTCKAERWSNDEGTYGVRVSVRDTGVGIAGDDLDKVFEKFKQVGDTLTDKPSGTGLGLPICKQIIEHHGGTVGVNSELGKGSEFWFTLPEEAALIRAEHKTVEAFMEANGSFFLQTLAKRVGLGNGKKPQPGVPRPGALLVLPNERLRRHLRQRIEALGLVAHEAADVNAALTLAKRAPLEVVVLDLDAFEEKGIELAAALRKQQRTSHVKFMNLSHGGESEQGFAVALDRLFARPIRRSSLLEELTLLGVGKNAPVLLADQDPASLQAFASLLGEQGYAVSMADSMEACLEQTTTGPLPLLLTGARFASRFDLLRSLRFEHGCSDLRAVLLS